MENQSLRLNTIAGLGAMLLCLCGSAMATEDGAKQLDIPRITATPIIDGVILPGEWSAAAHVTDFTQVFPVEGAPPSEQTEAWLAYDADHLYVAFRALDRNPELIVAQRIKEDDEVYEDDSVYITLDTFLDRRNAFFFVVNPLGTKHDARVEHNVNFRPEWDGIWLAKATRDQQGWYVEAAIPFKTLSFKPGSGTWGLNLARRIARHNERIRWANISQDSGLEQVSNFGDLHGLTGLDQGKGIELRPSFATRTGWKRNDLDFTVKPGGEIVYRVTPSLNASLILNPDFSDTVVDEIQTNLTRFSLFFPEQRDFFVRDADIFEFGGLRATNGIPFFSRRIGLPGDVENPDPLDIDVGVKLSGRYGNYTLGMLNTQMGDFGDLGHKNLTVIRATRDVLEESSAGMVFTYGDPLTDNDNALAGVDFRYRNSRFLGDKNFTADAYVMGSSTAGVRGDELAYGLRLEYPNDLWYGKANFGEIQENFNPALGFVNRPGIRQYDGELRRRFRLDAHPLIRSMDFGVQWNVTTDRNNDLESVWISTRLLTLESQDGDFLEFWYDYHDERLSEPFEIQPRVFIPASQHIWHNIFMKLETTRSRPVRGGFEFAAGEFYDGTQQDFTGRLTWQPFPKFLIGVERRYINTNLPGGDFDIEINRLRVQFNFSPTISWTSFLQQETESHFATLNSQLRWIIRPGDELWLTLNQDWKGEDDSYRPTEGELFTKIFWTKRF